MRPEPEGGWRAYNPDGSAHACGRPEKAVRDESRMSPAMEGRVRQIAREVAEQVLKEKLGGIVE